MTTEPTRLIEARVLVPADRVASFYDLTARFLEGKAIPTRAPRRSRRPSGPTASSYAPLGDHLRDVEGDETALTFPEIEEAIGRPLPASARKHRAWWANTDTHSQALVWLDAGWKVQAADLEAGEVSFTREVKVA